MKFFLPLVILSLSGLSVCAQTAGNDSTAYQKVSGTDSAKRSNMISIGPALMNFKLDKGQNKTQTLYLVNRKNTKHVFNLSVKDFTLDSFNRNVTMPAGTSEFSCSDWITLDRTYVEVNPHTTEKIMITVNVPDNDEAVKKMRWSLVEVKADSEPLTGQYKKDDVKVALNPKPGVGVQVYQTPPNALKDMKMLSFNKVNDTCRIVCSNTGLTRLEFKASIELVGMDSDVKEVVSKEGMQILPGTVRYIDLILPKSLPKGKYNAIAILDAGDDDVPLEASQSVIEIN